MGTVVLNVNFSIFGNHSSTASLNLNCRPSFVAVDVVLDVNFSISGNHSSIASLNLNCRPSFVAVDIV